MRVLIAPDCFGGTLSAVQAAAAIASGWAQARPGDELVCVPLSDGGPGFVAVLHAALGGSLRTVQVADPLGRPVSATWLQTGAVAYLEAAQACGLHLLAEAERDPRVTSTFGVGELLLAALSSGVSRIVVGLGGSATNDGGAGLCRALGLRPVDRWGAPVADGGAALQTVAALRGALLPELSRVQLVIASDVDAPLLGRRGASAVFGPQKGAAAQVVCQLDQALARWADVLEAALAVRVRESAGAGAAGGLGAALLALGAQPQSGIALVSQLVGLAARADGAQLVVTGEGRLDRTSLRGKVVSGVAALAKAQGQPCLVLAGQVELAPAEAASLGIDAVYALVDDVGLATALAAPAASLRALAARVARQWSPDV